MKNFSLRRFRNLVKKIQKQRILVLGDVMLDEFIWGSVSRISPEAPVPVVRVTKENAYPGGASNVARNLGAFNIPCGICGLIGNDTAGKQLTSILKKGNVDTSGFIVEKNFTTILKTRIIARQQQVVRVDRETPLQMTPPRLSRLMRFLKKALPDYDAIILQDYGKGIFTQDVIDQVTDLAKSLNKLITADPTPGNPLIWKGADLVKPNRIEAYAAAKVPYQEDDTSLKIVGEKLIASWDIPNLLITLSERGMMLFSQKQKPHHIPTRAREVFDVSGAGDTSIAFLTAAMSAGIPLPEAADLANHAAGVVVGKLGTATLTPQELETFYLDLEASSRSQ